MIHIFHKWNKWEKYEEGEIYDVNGNKLSSYIKQSKECNVCGKMSLRRVRA